MADNWACQTHGDSSKLVQFEMETSHVHPKYLIILIKQALFFNSKHSCQVLNENEVSFLIWLILFFYFSLSIQKHVARPVKFFVKYSVCNQWGYGLTLLLPQNNLLI